MNSGCNQRTELSKVEKVGKEAPVLMLAPYEDGVEVDVGRAHHLVRWRWAA